MKALRAVILAACVGAFAPAAALPAGEPSRDQERADGWRVTLRSLPARPRVLFVGAHPDDENAVAGLLSWLAARGELVMVTLTAGHNLDTRARMPHARGRTPPVLREPWGDPPARRGSELAARRAAVFRTVAELLGARQAIVGPFVNGPLALAELGGAEGDGPYRDWRGEAPEIVLAKWGRDVGADADAAPRFLARMIRTFRPDAVVSFDGWCGGTGHPEHLAAAAALARALTLAGEEEDPAGNAPGDARMGRARPLWITSAFIAPPLAACGYRTCQGEPPREPVLVLDLEAAQPAPGPQRAPSPRVAKCLALIHYATASRQGGVSGRQTAALRRLCEGAAPARTPAREEIRIMTPPEP